LRVTGRDRWSAAASALNFCRKPSSSATWKRYVGIFSVRGTLNNSQQYVGCLVLGRNDKLIQLPLVLLAFSRRQFHLDLVVYRTAATPGNGLSIFEVYSMDL
jgi:hypothetical protein